MALFAALIYTEEKQPTPKQIKKLIGEYEKFNQKASDVVVSGEWLQPTMSAETVSVDGKGGNATHKKGPSSRTKLSLSGYYLLDCEDMEDAKSWAEQIPGAWEGNVEVRPCH